MNQNLVEEMHQTNDPRPPGNKEPAKHGQKVAWSVLNRYSNYKDAKKHKDALVTQGLLAKIHRMGQGKKEFVVKLGMPIKKEKVVKEAVKKDREPARNDRKAKKAKNKNR